jgi:4a-hydroxytetrahydrobiopterin dehydratase
MRTGFACHTPVYNPGFRKDAEMASTTAGAGGLAAKSCKACAGKVEALSDAEAKKLLAEVPGWERQGGAITKTFSFKNYYETMAFVNASAWISHREDHHPDLEVGYNKCVVRYSTHSVGGLSESDFICAAKIEALFRL